MSLSKQLFGGVFLLLLLVFTASLWINVNSTRGYIDAQLSSHAQDTATSLGLSIAPYVTEAEQLPLVDAMMNAIFDRGYYQTMRLKDRQGLVIIEKTNPEQLDTVPSWFQAWFPLRPPEVSSEISSGWNLAGSLEIRSHPGIGYTQLWRNALQSLWISLALFVLAVVLAWLLLRQITRPLHAAVEQLETIGKGRFVTLDIHPKSRELRVFVEAINRMSQVLAKLFAELTSQAQSYRRVAFTDSLTQIGNRRAFEMDFTQRLTDKEHPAQGYLLLVRLSSLDRVNRQQGAERADSYVTDACQQMQAHVTQPPYHAQLYRLRGADFAVLVDALPSDKLDAYCDALMTALHSLSGDIYSHGVAHMGVSPFSSDSQQASVIEKADSALTNARNETRGWLLADNVSLLQSNATWREQIQQVLSQQQVTIFRQAVKSSQGQLLYQECFARFSLTGNDEFIPMAQLIPASERLHHAAAIDKLVVAHVLDHLIDAGHTLAINLSTASIADDDFCQWLCAKVTQVSSACHHLVFEISEHCVLQSPQNLTYIAEQLHRHGAKITLEHFGASHSAFAYLMKLRPDFIKLDGRYTRDIHQHSDNQMYVQTLVNIAHGLGIQVIAEQVETAAQANQLNALFVDYLQGYFIDRPSVWSH